MRKICAFGLVFLSFLSICGCNANNNSSSTQEIRRNEMSTIIDLEGTKNTRDLGGYRIDSNKVTRGNLFFRSDNTNNLTNYDVMKLIDKHNLKHVIDLRYESEITSSPDKLSNVEGVTYHNIPLYIPKEQMKSLIKGDIDLGDAYIKSLEQKDVVKNIFGTIASIDDGALLFHCTNGKDRTGIVSALLLGLCGVSNEDIISNYSLTYELIKDSDAVKNGIEKYGTDVIFKSYPEYMNKLLVHINDNYSDIENYLIECGISKENIDKIRDRFIV